MKVGIELKNAVAALSLGALAACGSEMGPASPVTETHEGAPVSMYGALVKTAVVMEDGVVTSVDTQVPLAMVQSSMDRSMSSKEVFVAPFDASSRPAFFDHLNIVFFNRGLTTIPVYSEPLYAFHFMGIDVGAENAIDCAAEPAAPAPGYMPEGYKYLGPGLFPNDGGCVPGDGVHAIPTAAPEQQSPPGRFTATMLLGMHDGKVVHIEPMISRSFLLEKKDFSIPVPRPAKLGMKTRYPSRFDAKYDAASDSFRFSFSGFTAIE